MDTLNIQQAADVLKVHPKTVEDLIRDGTLPAAKIGRAWVMMTAHVMKYLENEIIQQTAARRGIPTPKVGKTTRRRP